MLHIKPFTFNAFQENTYLLVNDNKECWIVDPGMSDSREEQVIKQHIENNNLQLKAIINTHAHIDHILGVQMLKNTYKVPFTMHEKELPVLQNAMGSAIMFGLNLQGVPVADSFIKEGVPLQLGTDTLDVRFIPGHSPGSISFYYPEGNWVISGDALFNGSIGRTDLPGGHFDTLINSIRQQLFSLPDNTVVYSGHGPATNIANEKKYNPFLQN